MPLPGFADPAPTIAVLLLMFFAIREVLRRQREREGRFQQLADRLGLRYSRDDPFALGELPFELLRSGGAARIRNVISGKIAGSPVLAFEYRRMSRTEVLGREIPWAFWCALTSTPVRAAHLVIERQGRDAYQLGPAVGEAPRISTESVEFDRAFHVRTDDREFALAVLDPQVMGWLLTTPGRWSLEAFGSRLLAYAPLLLPAAPPASKWAVTLVDPREPSDLGGLEERIGVVREARARIPWSVTMRPPTTETLVDVSRARIPGDPKPRRARRTTEWVIGLAVLVVFLIIAGPFLLLFIGNLFSDAPL